MINGQRWPFFRYTCEIGVCGEARRRENAGGFRKEHLGRKKLMELLVVVLGSFLK